MYTSTITATLIALLMLCCASAAAQEISSIQLVGDFNSVTCEPNDPENNMELIDPHIWRKLVFIDEPEDPDTIQFEFTMNGSYLPENWGWSGTWGIAELRWDPPSIVSIIEESGYYYICFDDTSYAYWFDRPNGSISGCISADNQSGAPEDASVVLYNEQMQVVNTFTEFVDSTYAFHYLPPATYQLTTSAPGYRDTTVTGIVLIDGDAEIVDIRLTSETAVFISSTAHERSDKGVLLTWRLGCCSHGVGFDVYRSYEPSLSGALKRNESPIYGDREFQFFDAFDDQRQDLYYYLVERSDDNPTRFGPIHVRGITPSISTRLEQNYPNPFNPATLIPYTIGQEGENERVILSFYDVSGRMVDRHDLGPKPVGTHVFRWNPALLGSGKLPSGVYYCRLHIGKMTFTRKMILLR